jgi:ABC-type transporter Mla subunit MlaD
MAIALASLKVSAEFDAQAYVAGAKAKTDADAQMVASGEKVAGTVETTQRRLGESTARYVSTIRQLDPALATSITAQQRFETTSRNLQKALEATAITADQHAKLMAQAREQYDRNVAGANDNTRAVNTLSEAHERFSIQGQAAFHAARSMAEGLALGIPPTQILTQQLNHLIVCGFGPGGSLGGVWRSRAGDRCLYYADDRRCRRGGGDRRRLCGCRGAGG